MTIQQESNNAEKPCILHNSSNCETCGRGGIEEPKLQKEMSENYGAHTLPPLQKLCPRCSELWIEHDKGNEVDLEKRIAKIEAWKEQINQSHEQN